MLSVATSLTAEDGFDATQGNDAAEDPASFRVDAVEPSSLSYTDQVPAECETSRHHPPQPEHPPQAST
jgi:hypothetical protein